jgi:hypothetical protein
VQLHSKLPGRSLNSLALCLPTACHQSLHHRTTTRVPISCAHVGADGGCQRPFVQEQARPQSHCCGPIGVSSLDYRNGLPPTSLFHFGGSATFVFQPTLTLIPPATDTGGVTRRQLHADRVADQRLPPSGILRPRHPIRPLVSKVTTRFNVAPCALKMVFLIT